MKKTFTPLIFIYTMLVGLISCSSSHVGILSKKTAREKYQQRIEKLLPQQSDAWKYAGEFALQHPLAIPVPYAETGFISGDKADATAFYFSVKAGQKVNVYFNKTNPALTSYTELWQVKENNERILLASADTLLNTIQYSSLYPGNFMVRLQPQLGARGSYTLSILINPILGFPIIATANSSIGSYWGDARDDGARKHEGIDIFAKKGTAIVAVADGIIDYVEENDLGGKVISLIPFNQNYSVYYAHLDNQLVQDGQRVKKGDIIGTVGNTGNAKFTQAHLHFGIYNKANQAIDPLYFVQKINAPIIYDATHLNEWYFTSGKAKLYPSPARQNAYTITDVKIKTESYCNNFYRVQLENGSKAFVAANDLTNKMKL